MRRLLAPLAFLLAAACSKNQPAPTRPIVVLQFENLSGDSALDWMSRGAPRQVAVQIGGLIADSASPSAEREAAIAGGHARILHGYISRTGDRLRLRADLENAAQKSFSPAEASGPMSGGLIPLAAAVARELDPAASAAGAKNDRALEAYSTALSQSNPAAASEAFGRAIDADPDYAAAYLSLIQLQSGAMRDRDAAGETLARARARGEAIGPADRARLDLVAAQISGNSADAAKALAAIGRAVPGDANVIIALANAELAAKNYKAAIADFERALALQPDDPALLNTLGYAHAYSGNLAAAVKVLRDYHRVRPNDANPLDSLAEVHFYYGNFPEASKLYREAYQKDATFADAAPLMKAAVARLFSGDAAGAESLFVEYESQRNRAGDGLIGLARARWLYLRGQRAEAIRRVEALAGSPAAGPAAAAADCTLSVWLLEAGDRAGAASHKVCGSLADPKAPFANPVMRVYSLLLNKDFSAAAPPLREMVERAPPSPGETAPMLLAWALVESGKIDDAVPYLRFLPAPGGPASPPFESLVYPRMFHLRAVAAEKKGDRAEAERNARLYATLSGK